MFIHSRNHPRAFAVLACMQHEPAYLAWRRELEDYCSAMGARCALEHVSESRWRFWFEQGQNAESAVLTELIEVSD